MGIRIRLVVTETKKQPKQTPAQFKANLAEGQRIANAAKNGSKK